MTEHQINAALDELRKEIEQLPTDDPSVKERLTDLVGNIELSLSAPIDDKELQDDLIEEMREAVTHFEVEHPRITGILGEILMTLSNMGI